MENKIHDIQLACLKCNSMLPDSLLSNLEWLGGHHSYKCPCGESILSLPFIENTLNHSVIFLQFPVIRILDGHAIVFQEKANLNEVNSVNLKKYGIEENDSIIFINYTPNGPSTAVENFRAFTQANGNSMFFNEIPKEFDFFPSGVSVEGDCKNPSFVYSLYVVFMKRIEITDYSLYLLSRAFSDLYNNQHDRLLKEVLSSIEMNLKEIISIYCLDQPIFGGKKKKRPFWSSGTQESISGCIANRHWPSKVMMDLILQYTTPRAMITHEGFQEITREDACKMLATGILIHAWQKSIKKLDN